MQFSKAFLACAVMASAAMQVSALTGQTGVYTASGALAGQSGTFGALRDGSSAWLDEAGSKFHNIPAHVDGAPYLAKTQTTASGEIINFECGAAKCDAFVFIYECGKCFAEKGGLPLMLVADGWERSRCAPSFVKASGAVHHRMVSYRLTITNGVHAVTLPGDVEYAMFAVRENAIECDTFATGAECNAPSTLDFCKWQGACMTNRCMYATTGVTHNNCPVCVADDVLALP